MFLDAKLDRNVLQVNDHLAPHSSSEEKNVRIATAEELVKLRGIANYQLGRGAGAIFKRGTMIAHSRRTGRMRHLYYDRKLLATLRPTDGMIALSIQGARMLMKNRRFRNLVTVQTDVSEFIKSGRNVFAKHVIQASRTIRPEDEVIVINEERKILATGRAFLSGEEMLSFKRGVAVKVRHGVSESKSYRSIWQDVSNS